MTISDTERMLLATPVNTWVAEQSIIFDWHDGPREGVCRLSLPNIAVYFRVFAENMDKDQANLFSVSVISLHDYEQVELLLQALGSPHRPTWIPRWHFESESQRLAVEEQLDRLLKHVQPSQLLICTPDMVTFQEAWIQVRQKQ
jgi:hypothetical protein